MEKLTKVARRLLLFKYLSKHIGKDPQKELAINDNNL